jgi:uncharacterized protein (UPF0333 family)
MNKKVLIGIAITLIVAVAIIAAFFYLSQKQPKDSVSTDFKIKTQGNNKVIQNDSQKYELTVSKLLIARADKNGNINLFNKEALNEDCFDCPPDIRISVLKNTDNLSLEKWLEDENGRYGFTFWNQRSEVTANNQKGYRILMEGDPEMYYYYFSKDQNIYVISTLTDVDFSKALQNVVFK